MAKQGETTKIIGLLSTTAVACLATTIGTNSGSSLIPALTSSVLGGLSIELAGNYIESLKYAQIKEWFIKSHPPQVSQDLQKALQSALIHSLGNIRRLYKSHLKNKKDAKKLNTIISGFQEQIAENFASIQNQSTIKNELKNYLYDDPQKAFEELLNNLQAKLVEFDSTNSQMTFTDFFKQNISTQFQLCFSEELKDNNSVWISFQQLIAEDTKQKLELIIRQQEEIKAISNNSTSPELNTDDLRKLKIIAQKLSKPGKLSNAYKAGLYDFISQVENSLKQIVTLQTENLSVSTNNYNISITTAERVKHFDRKLDQKWVKKKKILFYSIILLFLFALIYQWQANESKPLPVNILMHLDEKIYISPEYLSLGFPGKLEVFLDEWETVDLNIKHEGAIQNLHRKDLGKEILVRVNDPYWETTTNKIKIDKQLRIPIRPTNALAKLRFEILHRDETKLDSSVEVSIDNGDTTIVSHTGIFVVDLPYRMLKPQHKIRVCYKGACENDNRPSLGLIQFRLKK
jgi:hypothetical protein